MDTLHQLLGRYRDAPKVQQIAQIINAQKADGATAPRLQLAGLTGAQDTFVLAATYLAEPCSHLFIALNKDEATYIQNDLESLLAQKTVHLLVDSFRAPRKFGDLDANNVLSRNEVVAKMSQSHALGEIVVTYPEALFEKVVAPRFLDAQRIEINKGEKLDTDFLIQLLVEYGFTRTDFVYEPGQFSVRGGIVDVFSYANEYPYRIELFDIEVESIRTFDPTTQLSQQNIARVSIVPNLNTRFEQQQKVSIFDILPPKTAVWLRDFEYLLDQLQKCFDAADTFAQDLSVTDEEELRIIFRDRAFVRPIDVVQSVLALPMLVLDKDVLSLPADISPKQFRKTPFSSQSQPSINKDFKRLIAAFQENTKQKIENFLFTENEKQMARLFSIFKDLNANVQVTPVYKSLREGFVDTEMGIACYTDHQIFERYHAARRKKGFSREQSLTVKLLRELQAGDYVTHIDHGVGKFSGLEKININGQIQEAVRLVYQGSDLLYVGIQSLHKIAKYVGKEGTPPKLNKLGTDTWNNLKRATKKRVKDIAGELIKLYAARRASKGFAFPIDGYLQNELEASFIYEDTPDQYKATQEVKTDMEKEYPMDRLICGDVGFGKTEVAIRAAFKAAINGKQVAILVPTTFLASQHHRTFTERLDEFGVTVAYLSRRKTAKEKKETLEQLKSGQIDIIVGTHALLGKETVFKDLGLLIIDEEQKFGVAAKEKLRRFKVNVDTLTLTATPIPRTLQFSLMSARDLSVMRTPPPNRQPIYTEVRTYNEALVKEVIYNEVARGGQVFLVEPTINGLVGTHEMLKKLCPDVDMAIVHGQMPADDAEVILSDFVERKYDVLLATTIIETGIDIPNANTIIIKEAHRFGMSDLHQLRGRVGRSNKKAFCYLFAPPLSTLPTDAKRRLKALEEFSDLGSGFNIAMRDLDIRGAGNMLGGEQSGFIADIGYQTYQKILEEAILELKQTDFKDLFSEEMAQKNQFILDVQIDTDIEMHIPDEYVSNTQERLNLYTELDTLETEADIAHFSEMLLDRFGKIPFQVEELFDGLRLRWDAKVLGFERIVLKNQKLQCYFVGNPQSPFYETQLFKNLLQFVSGKGKKNQLTFKQSQKHFILIRENVRTLSGARNIIEILRGAAQGELLEV